MQRCANCKFLLSFSETNNRCINPKSKYFKHAMRMDGLCKKYEPESWLLTSWKDELIKNIKNSLSKLFINNEDGSIENFLVAEDIIRKIRIFHKDNKIEDGIGEDLENWGRGFNYACDKIIDIVSEYQRTGVKTK